MIATLGYGGDALHGVPVYALASTGTKLCCLATEAHGCKQLANLQGPNLQNILRFITRLS